MPSHAPANKSRNTPSQRMAAVHDRTTRPNRPRSGDGELDPIFQAYLEALKRRRRAQLTIYGNSRTLKSFNTWLNANQIPAGELTMLACEQYYADLTEHYAIPTVRQHLTAVRAAYQYGIRHQLADHDPTLDVKLPRLPDIEPETYTTTQLRAIHAAIASERDELLFHLLAYAGLRLGEITRLTWEQVDLDHQQIKPIGKAGKLRLVPLHPTLRMVLAEHQPRRHPDQHRVIISYNHRHGVHSATCGREIRKLVDNAHVPINNAAHAFRKTVATDMHEQGVPTAVIDKIMGWAPRTVRERHYLRIADHAMHQAIQTLYQHDPICPEPGEIPTTPSNTSRSLPTDLDRELTRLVQLEKELGLQVA
jgi:site-specific recombinase XerD